MLTFNPEKPVIQTESLSKEVITGEDKLVILHDVKLEIAFGETIAIIGTSGAGKTTLLGLLAGLDLPTSGRVILGDIEITKLSEEQRASLRGQNLGFVFQSFYLLANLTALENVMLPLELMGKTDAFSKATSLLKEVGLAHRLKHYPRQLSGGEQQRVAIARAFVVSPKILFADEPTGNLDQETGEHVMDLLFNLNKAHQTTLVIVTHDQQLAARCNRRIELEKGEVMI